MIMIENYLTGLIWKHFMENQYVLQGLEQLDITLKGSSLCDVTE